MNPVIITRDEATISPTDMDSKALPGEKNRLGRMQEGEDRQSSLMNIQTVCQMSQRGMFVLAAHSQVSYDICKNNEHVAQLILLRGAYKLGESVVGVVNFEKNAIPCFQVGPNLAFLTPRCLCI